MSTDLALLIVCRTQIIDTGERSQALGDVLRERAKMCLQSDWAHSVTAAVCKSHGHSAIVIIITTSTPVIQTGVYPHMPITITGPFVTFTFNLSPLKVIQREARRSNIIILAVIDVSCQKYELDFWPLTVIQG